MDPHTPGNLKQLIDLVITRLTEVRAVRELTAIREFPDASLAALARFINGQGFDSALGTRLAALLQLADEASHCATYDLQDIGRLYEALLAAGPEDLDLHIEAGYFFDSVLSDAPKGKALAQRARTLLHRKELEIQKLWVSIGEEAPGDQA